MRSAPGRWRLPAGARLISNRVTGIDWLIVAFTALLAFYGYMQGFIVGALSLRRLRARRVRRHAARAAAAAGRIALAVRAAVRSARRAARRRDARQRLRGPRRPRPSRAAAAGLADDRRTARSGADRVRRARDRVDRRRRRARRLGLDTAAPGHPAVGDPAGAQHAAAALRRDPPRARPLRSAAVGHRTRGRRGAAQRRDPADERGHRARAAASCESSEPRADSGSRAAAGSRRRASSSRTRTSSPGRPTPPCSSAAIRPTWPPTRWRSIRTTTSRSSASPA